MPGTGLGPGGTVETKQSRVPYMEAHVLVGRQILSRGCRKHHKVVVSAEQSRCREVGQEVIREGCNEDWAVRKPGEAFQVEWPTQWLCSTLCLEQLKITLNMRLNLFLSNFFFSGIRDVSKWSERTRKPLETLYGYDYLAKICEKWVDGIKQFKHLPDGRSYGLFNALLLTGEAAWVPSLEVQDSLQISSLSTVLTHCIWAEDMRGCIQYTSCVISPP